MPINREAGHGSETSSPAPDRLDEGDFSRGGSSRRMMGGASIVVKMTINVMALNSRSSSTPFSSPN